MTLSPVLEQKRALAARNILIASGGSVFVLMPIAWVMSTGVWVIGLLSLAATGTGLLMSRAGPRWQRLGAGLALACQPLLLSAAFAGHIFVMDSHLVIVASLIACSMLVDVPAIVASVILICVHHIAALLLHPLLAFDSMNMMMNFERMAFHAGAVIVAAGALIVMIRERVFLDREATIRQTEAQTSAERATAATADAIAAREDAERHRLAAEHALRQAELTNETILRETAAKELLEAELSRARVAEIERERKAQRGKDFAIDAMRAVMPALAKGDLTIRLDESLGDEYEDLRTDFNGAVESLRCALMDIHSHTDLILGESSDIATSTTDFFRRTEQQARTLEELALSTNQLSELISSAASDAKEAEDVVLATRSEALAGTEIMGRAIEAMGEIEATSSDVRKITTVIDDIAFQTNLLALNAGVEAARAGSAGRGFAVVASEVRALAKRSSEAANRINTLIGQSATQIQDGVTLVRDTGSALEQIIGSISQTSERMVQIASKSSNQAVGIGEVNKALRELDVVAQKNSAMFEETTAACETLTTSAQALSQSVAQFLTDRAAERTIYGQTAA